MVQISDFKLSAKLSVIYHDQMEIILMIIEQATTKYLLRIFILWNILAKSGQSFGSLS